MTMAQNYASLSVSTSMRFLKICSMIHHNKHINHWSKTSNSKSSFLGQIDNSGLIMNQNYASLYLRIYSKDSFKLCNMISPNKQIKFIYLKFPQNCFSGSEFFVLFGKHCLPCLFLWHVQNSKKTAKILWIYLYIKLLSWFWYWFWVNLLCY